VLGNSTTKIILGKGLNLLPFHYLPRSRRRPLRPHRRCHGRSAWLGVVASVSSKARAASSPRSGGTQGKVLPSGRNMGEWRSERGQRRSARVWFGIEGMRENCDMGDNDGGSD
jgi:hypothetical protein